MGYCCFSQNAGTSKVCSDFNEQCEALRVAKMNLQLSSNILVAWITSFRMTLALQGCHEREERAFLSTHSASTRKVLEDLLPQAVVAAIHNALPAPLQADKVSRECPTRFAQSFGSGYL